MKSLILVWSIIGFMDAFTLYEVVAEVKTHPKTPPVRTKNCLITEFAVRSDSTYYQVDCGSKVKIKSIIETKE